MNETNRIDDHESGAVSEERLQQEGVLKEPVAPAETEAHTEPNPGSSEEDSVAKAEENEGIADGLMAVVEDLRPGALEALLFASGEPVPLQTLCRLIGATRGQTEEALKKLAGSLSEIGRGVELVEVAGRFQLRTKQSFGPQIRVLRAEKPKRLSPAALETLAIVAYRQPVVKSDIERIRGVDTTPTLKTLIERGLIHIVGHQQTVGSPALYGTTEEFLKVFGLKDLAALPTLREVGMIEAEPGDEGEEDGQSGGKNGEGEGASGAVSEAAGAQQAA